MVIAGELTLSTPSCPMRAAASGQSNSKLSHKRGRRCALKMGMSANSLRVAELLTKCFQSSDFDLAFQVKNYGALKLDTIGHKPADDLPAA
jgi:hypothetical protein